MSEFKNIQDLLGGSGKNLVPKKPPILPNTEWLDGVDNERALDLFQAEVIEMTDYSKVKFRKASKDTPSLPDKNITNPNIVKNNVCNIIHPNTHKLAVYDIGVLGQRILYHVLKNFQSRYKNGAFLENDNYTIDIKWSNFTKSKGSYVDYKKSLWKILSNNVMLEQKTPFVNEQGEQGFDVEIIALQLFNKLKYQDIYGSASESEKKRLRGVRITMTDEGYQFFRNLDRGYSQIDYDAIMSLKRYSSMRLYELLSGFLKRKTFKYGFQKLKLALLQNVEEIDEEEYIELEEEENTIQNVPPTLFSNNDKEVIDEEDKENTSFDGIKVKQYSSIYDFNRWVLNPAIEELKEKCPYFVEYEHSLGKNGDYLYIFYVKRNENFKYQSYQEIISSNYRKAFDLRNIFTKNDLSYLVEKIGISKKELLNNLDLIIIFVERYGKHWGEGGKEFVAWITKIYQVILEKMSKGDMVENPNGYIINCLKKELAITIEK